MDLLVTILSLLLSLLPMKETADKRTVQVPPICFRVDKTVYDPDYLDNRASVDSLVRLVEKVGEENVESIHVVAYASPEGWLWHNNELAKKRAYELRWLFRGTFPGIHYSKISCESGGESWSLLRERVAADPGLDESARERILKILDDGSLSNEMLKRKMKDLGGLYDYLLRTHYRYLRLGLTTITVRIAPPAEDSLPVAFSAEGSESSTGVLSSDGKESSTGVPSAEGKESSSSTTGAVDTVAIRESAKDSLVADKPLKDSTITGFALQPAEGSEVVENADNQEDKRHALLGISTNIPYDLTFIPGYGLTSIPSFSIEFYPNSGRYTFGADVEWPMWQHWDRHEFMQIQNVTLWARRYFKPVEDRFKGAYLFGNLNAVRYGIGWDEKGWEGEGVGASLGIGYKRYFGASRFFFDTGIGLGVFWSRYDPYVYGNDAKRWYYYDYAGKPEDFQERSKRLLWTGPTRLYFSIGYDLLMRKKK